MTEREFSIQVVQTLQDAGYQALWAGGCVRDEILKRPPNDYDVATDAHPKKVRKLFPRTIAIGMSFGVIEVLGPRIGGQPLKVQVATFRSDGAYSDGRHPDRVTFSSPREDALRRDFTINGMFFDPIENELHDFVNGRDDLQRKILRAIGDPFARFAEDKLRLLRAVRMTTRFDLEIEPKTAEAIKAMAAQINVVSAERIAEELRQILVHPSRVRAVRLLQEFGLVDPILPELPALQSKESEDDANAANLWDHTLRVLDDLGNDPTFPLAFAVLVHEVFPPCDHSRKSVKRIEAICDRLRLSNAEKKNVVWLVRHHSALADAKNLPLSVLKPLLAQPHIEQLLQLHRADALAKGGSLQSVEYCAERLSKWPAEELDPPQLFTGDDLRQNGLKPGPRFKELLDAVRAAQLNEMISTKEEALHLIEELLQGDNGNRLQ